MMGALQRGLVCLLLTSACAKKQAVEPSLEPPAEPPAEPTPRSTLSLSEMVEGFQARTGVSLHIYDPATEVPEGVGEKLRLEAPLSSEVVRLMPALERVVMTYPEIARLEGFRHLWLTASLYMGDNKFGGMAYPASNRLFLVIGPRKTETDLRWLMHHEIAHLFERHPSFNGPQWRTVSGGTYLGSNYKTQAVGSDEDRLAGGFVSKYAMKNRHEDFAELASYAFVRPDEVRRWYEQHPAIRAKMEMLTTHYQTLAPGIVVPWLDGAWEQWKLDYPQKLSESRRNAREAHPPSDTDEP